jgi:hydrogenase nickel incorporation protein HypA/HybF
MTDGYAGTVLQAAMYRHPMHELALSESIVDLVVECARRERIVRVTRVVAEIGVAASVDTQTLLFCFPIAASETIAAEAELVIKPVGLRAKCDSCGTEHAPKSLIAPCPNCGSFAREILAGREMRVVSFDGE